jgi:two-component system NtrC family sensor kinase
MVEGCLSRLTGFDDVVFFKGIIQMSTDEPQAGKDLTTEELRQLIAEHEAKLVEIADLVAHARHEINNPLTGIIGQAQLLLRAELDSVARRRIETIEQLASRIRDIVARLRDVQRPHQSLDYDETK